MEKILLWFEKRKAFNMYLYSQRLTSTNCKFVAIKTHENRRYSVRFHESLEEFFLIIQTSIMPRNISLSDRPTKHIPVCECINNDERLKHLGIWMVYHLHITVSSSF